MNKQYLLDGMIKDMSVCRRLYTKIPADKMNFRPKEGMRSAHELLQYLSICGTFMIDYWYRTDTSMDLKTFYTPLSEQSKAMTHDQFIAAMDAQIEKTKELFSRISDNDLKNKEVEYPWKATAKLGQAIMETSIKWLAAYKMQLFLYIKLTSDQKLGTPDLWRLTDLTS